MRQGAMTVSEYAVRLNDLASHAPALVATVRERVRRFIEGLYPSIRISMVRELEMDISYRQVVSIATRLEGMLARYKDKREAKRSLESGTYSGTRASAAVRHGRGYGSRPANSALPAASGILVPSRPHEPYYAPLVSSVPPKWGVPSGQSNRPSPSQSQQSRPPRSYFECGDTLHMVMDLPRLRRGEPSQTSQAHRAPPGPQAMILALATTPPAQPARGGGRGGRGRPRGGG
ncbi:uncharacterized protein [Nicotiana tomentosiformis]|uniref:uncharacterized protein n=1 Tax=Nicotiana tomentosiformis TaxID=4098 RepID=UPI00388C9B84